MSETVNDKAGMKGTVFCFGEILLRFSPELGREWIKNEQVPVYVGGAELNVATALSKWNIPSKYFTAVPDNNLSKEIIEDIRAKKIDVSAIHFSGNRIGTYYLPQGTDLKNAGAIYDRAHSSFSELKPGMIDWSKALEGCSWFHFSAISPALNTDAALVCKEALEAASAKGLTISVDLNYRAKLWQYGKQPVEVMPALVEYCDVLMGNIWAVEQLLGIDSPLKDSIGKNWEDFIQASLHSMKQLQSRFLKLQSLAFTFRMDHAYFAILNHLEEIAVSKLFILDKVTDKVGSGDCFMGGLIRGLYKQLDPQEIINFAAAAAVSKMQVKGDATDKTESDIVEFLNQNTSSSSFSAMK